MPLARPHLALTLALTLTPLGACSDAAPGPVDDATAASDAIDSIDTSTATSIDAIDATDASDDATDPTGDVAPEDASDAVALRTTYAFEPVAVTGATPVWGATFVGDLLIGGVNAAQRAQDGIYRAVVGADGVEAQLVAGLDVARYCLCAAFDPTRHELLVVGGRGSDFNDRASAILVNVADGAVTPIADANGAADHPVGCSAWYAPGKDRAYVYGGLSSTARAFTATTYRWNPETRAFGALRADGPPARYDAALRVMADGDALLASGMGFVDGAVHFFDDLWRFDAATETWAEIVPATATRPPGRRYAWSALAPDESFLVFGFGSDSPAGQTVIADLWTFTFATGVWAPLAVDGALPPARGFTQSWQTGDGDAGLLAFGSDAAMQVPTQVFALRVPDALRGAWH